MVDFSSVLVGAVVGAVVGFLAKVIYDELKTPRLGIRETVGPFLITYEPKKVLNLVSGAKKSELHKMYHAYRIRVYNKQKTLFNLSAKNCVAWLELETAKEPYQLCWVGEETSPTINVGDYREVALCARNVETGVILMSTEKGYSYPSYRIIGDGKRELAGHLRITSENSKRTKKKILVKPVNRDLLEIELSDC